METSGTHQVIEAEADAPVRCPICARPNQGMDLCRHVRWTFDQGGPLDFAYFALETSAYVHARGRGARDIGTAWLEAHGEWIVERILFHFDASDGYVFGEVSSMLLLAARRDPLTGLCNRTSFTERLEQALCSIDVDGGLLAVAYLDIDHFKLVNDNFGHDVGDALLKDFGRRLEAALKHSDTVARLGGDEFALIMTQLMTPTDLRIVGTRLLASLRHPFVIGPHSIRTSASIGFAIAMPGDSVASLLERADKELYEVKRNGRDGISQALSAGASADSHPA